MNESFNTGNHFYETEPLINNNEARSSKYFIINEDKLRRTHSKLKRYKNSDRILLKSKQPQKLKTSTNF